MVLLIITTVIALPAKVKLDSEDVEVEIAPSVLRSKRRFEYLPPVNHITTRRPRTSTNGLTYLPPAEPTSTFRPMTPPRRPDMPPPRKYMEVSTRYYNYTTVTYKYTTTTPRTTTPYFYDKPQVRFEEGK